MTARTALATCRRVLPNSHAHVQTEEVGKSLLRRRRACRETETDTQKHYYGILR